MKIHNFPQGSTAWHRVRCGIPTASNFDKFITAKTLTLADNETSRNYRAKLLAEWLLGEPVNDDYVNQYMTRGTLEEENARKEYAFVHEVEVVEVGFVESDGVGCSPDGLVGDDGMIEVKTKGIIQHVRCMLQDDSCHMLQVQGNLGITGREWCDRIYYNPRLRTVTRRIERDDKMIVKINDAVVEFWRYSAADRVACLAAGDKPAPPFDASHYDEYGEPIPPADDAERLQAKFDRKESVTA